MMKGRGTDFRIPRGSDARRKGSCGARGAHASSEAHGGYAAFKAAHGGRAQARFGANAFDFQAPFGDSPRSADELRGLVRKSRRMRRAAVVAVLCVALAGAGGVFAWYCQTSGITNIFSKGAVEVGIDETFDPAAGEKRNVQVSVPGNNSTVPAYVRAQVDVYWEDAQGDRLWEAPVEKKSDPAAYDYELVWGTFDGAGPTWVTGNDGLYYWTQPVNPGENTGDIIASCIETRRHTDGRTLVVDIAVQAVQSQPAGAFADWAAQSGLVVNGDGSIGFAQAEGGVA